MEEPHATDERKLGAPIGERIVRARKAVQLTQVELAQQTEIPQGTISRYEVGGFDEIGALKLLRLARALGVSMEWLLTGEGVGPANAD